MIEYQKCLDVRGGVKQYAEKYSCSNTLVFFQCKTSLIMSLEVDDDIRQVILFIHLLLCIEDAFQKRHF